MSTSSWFSASSDSNSWTHSSINSEEVENFGGGAPQKFKRQSASPTNTSEQYSAASDEEWGYYESDDYIPPVSEWEELPDSPLTLDETEFIPEENFTTTAKAQYTLRFNEDGTKAFLTLRDEDLFVFDYSKYNLYHVESIDDVHDRLIVFIGNDPEKELYRWNAETKHQRFARYVEEESHLPREFVVNFRVGQATYRHLFLPNHTMERLEVYANYYATTPMFEMIHINKKISTDDFSKTLENFGIQSDDIIRIMAK